MYSIQDIKECLLNFVSEETANSIIEHLKLTQ
jgi:hypothetical protein